MSTSASEAMAPPRFIVCVCIDAIFLELRQSRIDLNKILQTRASGEMAKKNLYLSPRQCPSFGTSQQLTCLEFG